MKNNIKFWTIIKIRLSFRIGGKDMKLRLSVEEFDKGLEELSKKYLILAPRTFEKGGHILTQMLLDMQR